MATPARHIREASDLGRGSGRRAFVRLRAPLAVVTSICVAALGVVGCGGGSGGSETAGVGAQVLSKGQYVTRAEAICRQANKRQEALLAKDLESRKSNAALSNSDRVAFVMNAGLPPLKEETSQLAELDVRPHEQQKAQALVRALRKALGEIEAAPLAFSKGNSKTFLPVARQAAELRLQVCGSP